jgi:hypothetical protein
MDDDGSSHKVDADGLCYLGTDSDAPTGYTRSLLDNQG